MSADAQPRLVGSRVQRVEDARFTTGRGRYLDDFEPAGTLHMRVVRSEMPSAVIERVTIGEFQPPPAETELVTGQDVSLGIRADTGHESWQVAVQPALAGDRVRYVGEPVAVVLHPDAYVVEDAAEAVSIDYGEIFQPVADLAEALRPGAPLVHETWRDNLFLRRRRTFGDVAGARESARHVVRRAFRTGRQAGVPLEGRGCLAVPAVGGNGLTLWASTQIPHLLRTFLAEQLGLDEHAIRVVAPDVGGGFGVKAHVFPEELLVADLALRLQRPIKWVEDRVEHLVASIHARDHLHVVEAYVDEGGRVLGLRAQIVVDAGAYSVYPWTAASDPGMAAKVLLGPYDVSNYEVEDIAVATNKCPLGTYRGVARPSAVFTMERLIDEIACELRMDPIDVRLANVVRRFPHRTPTGLEYDPGTYAESLKLMRDLIGDDAARTQAAEAERHGRAFGIGIALYNEQTAHGTHDFEIRGTPIETGYESVTLRVGPRGDATVYTGLQSHGQSLETTLAQVAADELGLPLERVRVVHGDTANSPYAVGTWGSRGAALGGGATLAAAREVREKILAIAAYALEADPDNLVIQNGIVSVRGAPSVCVDVRQVAYWANRRTAKLPRGVTPGLEATSFLDGPDHGVFSNACHAAMLEVDRETGKVELRRYVVVEDCGVMINPTVVDGQIHGGVAQGIGSALLEESVYSEDAQPQSSTFMDYLLPTASDLPHVEVHHLETPTQLTPLGAKGMGEAGAIGPMAAIANAVGNALGVSVSEVPLRMERVWRSLEPGRDAASLWQRWAGHETLAEFWIGESASPGQAPSSSREEVPT
ncbi:MAG: xanthine dehydrogenase family protein molybdopterin-binding subunit [Candidatus Limnocylindria bacterium]